MLSSNLIDVETNSDFFDNKVEYLSNGNKIIYTGMIDKFFNYCFGELEYRSLSFKLKILNDDNYQGNAVVNYTDKETPYTRIIEHKHFEPDLKVEGKTVLTYEYPKTWSKEDEPYYPINDRKNRKLYSSYVRLSRDKYPNVIFGGRLGQYRYYNMDQTIMAALQVIKKEFPNE